MRSSAIIVAAAATLAGLASASPAHKFDKHAAHIAYTYPNGTFTKPFDVVTNGKAQQLRKSNPRCRKRETRQEAIVHATM